LAAYQGADLIRKAILTSADIGESIAVDALICGDAQAVLADKAYEAMTRRDALIEAGITDRIMHRRQAGKRQPGRQEWMNVAITPWCGQAPEALRHHEAALPLPGACAILVSSATAASSGCSAWPWTCEGPISSQAERRQKDKGGQNSPH
jgi:IS5 family transposase